MASSLVSILSRAASIELAGSSLCSRTPDLGSVTDSNWRPRSAARNQAVRAVPASTARPGRVRVAKQGRQRSARDAAGKHGFQLVGSMDRVSGDGRGSTDRDSGISPD